MTRLQNSRMLILAAAVQVGLAALPAAAQVAAQQDGRALDANNRSGSGGFNGAAGRQNPGVSPSQIIYGNVTGGKEFRGPIAAPDPQAFFGPTAGRTMDRFIAGSSGVPQPNQPASDLSTPQLFFGQSRGVAPPPGTFRQGFTGTYLGTAATPQSNLGMSSTVLTDQFRQQRLGESSLIGNPSTLNTRMDQGDLLLQGPLEADNRATIYAGSPLFGIRLYRPDMAAIGNEDLTSLYGPSELYPARSDRFRFESAEIQRLRDQLEAQGQSPNDLQTPQEQTPGVRQPGSNNTNQPNQPPPLGAPDNQSMDTQVTGSVNANPTAGGGLNTGQGVRQRSTLMTPGQQSQQYNELQRRLQQYENPRMAQIEAQHRAELQQRAQAGGQNNANVPGATTRPTGTIPNRSTLRQPRQSALNPNFHPMRIESMATGMRGTGVKDLLKSAEDLMRQGKFQSAIDKYNLALQAVPNNPLVFLGRANAELGAGFYRQASSDLHQVFLTDRATLMAQYDLKSWIPSDRLKFIQKDLKNLATQDPKDEMAPFLLAYIYYNIGDPAQASHYLQQAQERAGGRDPLLDLLQSHWRLSEANPAPANPPAELNK